MISDIEVQSVDEFDDINRGQGWDIEYRQLQRGSFRARMQALDAPGALVSHEEVTGPIDVRTAQPEGTVALLMPDCPLGVLRVNGYLADGRRAFLVSSGAEIEVLGSSGVICRVVRASRDSFERIAAAFGPVRPLQRAETRLVDLAAHQICGIQTAVDELLSTDQRALGSVESCLANLHESVAQLSLKQDGDREESLSDPRALRRVLEFIDANLRSDLSLVDLCETAYLQRRSLQRLFKKAFGISPMQYVLACRMNVVRRQLLASDPREISVSRVAQDYGFAHLGRFAGEYRKFFSQLPSETPRFPVRSSAHG